VMHVRTAAIVAGTCRKDITIHFTASKSELLITLRGRARFNGGARLTLKPCWLMASSTAVKCRRHLRSQGALKIAL